MAISEKILSRLKFLYEKEGKNALQLRRTLEASNKNAVYDILNEKKFPGGQELCSWLDKMGAEIAFPDEQMNGFVLIPRVKAVAGAGESFEIDNEIAGTYAFRESFFKEIGVKPKNSVLMFVRGDSMEPLIKDRDMVLIDKDDTTIREGYVYVIGYEGSIMVKRLQRITGGWNICSENPSYTPLAICGDELNKFRVMGRVRWFGRVV